MVKRFTKRNEGFCCLHCGGEVPAGSHGTIRNHCPSCLYSQHTDIDPGDRAATCRGLMTPVHAYYLSGTITLVHRCARCGFERENKIAQAPGVAPDDLPRVYALMRESAHTAPVR
ncbi:MAG: RNHCP domain-containing protein [Deltaproteobacteria bacterium]|nr:RNHCP domain-containing protein [Deltaproteobacteria bacterium]